MNNICFVFCHGWASDKDFWIKLHPYFQGYKCILLDAGYFGEETDKALLSRNTDLEFIGIGHSFGLTKLLSLDINFKALIGLQCFIDFLGTKTPLYNKRLEELSALKKGFIHNPLKTLKSFYRRSNMPIPNNIKNFHKDKLLEDLNNISLSFILPSEIPTLILGSYDDIIVSPEIIYDNFSTCPNVKVDMLKDGGHNICHNYSTIIYKKIMEFLDAYIG